MAHQRLPRQISLFKAAEQKLELSGDFAINQMKRLCQSLEDADGLVSVRLSFGRDIEQFIFIEGHIEANVVLQCQRCLQSMACLIKDKFLLSPVDSEQQQKELPERYEPLLNDREQCFLLPVIEDELILRLPIVALHDSAQCNYQEPESQDEFVEETKRDNPFEVLLQLK